MIAGLMSDKTRSMCKDVRKLVRSRGEGAGAGAGSWKIEDNGGADDCPRARLNVSLRDEKPRDVDEERDAWLCDGGKGRYELVGDVGVGFLGDAGGALRLPAKDRRNDHSDSN